MRIAKTFLTTMLFIGAILLISNNIQAQQTITIGTATNTSSTLPSYYYYNYSWSQSIFLASEIGMSGTISKIAYNVYSSGTYNYSNQKIYIYEASTNDFSTNSSYENPLNNGATLVYSGQVSFTNGWNEINLQTPFYYSGNNNLIICYENRNGAGTSYPNFYATSNSYYRSKYYYNNTLSTAFGTNGYTNTYRPNIKLTISQSSNDLAVTEWTFPTSGTTGSTAMPIILKVRNAGSAAQSGFLVKYSIDNGANWKSQTYSSSIGAGGSVSVNFFSSLTADMSSPGVYRGIAVVRNTGDTITNNDTLRKNITICGGSYSGIYTIGADASSDFPTINSAIEAINTCGISGPVYFKIKSGVYNEQIRIGSINGVTSSTPVTFESFTGNANDVVFQYANQTAADNYVVRLDTASYIRFKNMTFKTLGTTYSRVFEVFHSNNCSIENNQIIGYNGGSSGSNQDNIYIFSGTNFISNNILIKNNTIKYGAMGINTSGSSSTSYRQFAITLEGNNISDYGNTGVYTNYTDSLIIKQNIIKSLTGSTQAMYINYCNGIKEISRNQLISLQGVAMNIYQSSGRVGSPAIIANNFISNSGQTVYLYYSNYINFVYNSVHTISSNSNSLYVYQGSNITLKNNNVINSGGGYPINKYGTSNIIASDYNNYYSTGTYLAYWNSAQSTLAGLRSTSGMEAHSINSNVAFYSDDNLHATGQTLDAKGSPIAGITVDYDGQTRHTTTPDIGADEYELMANDAGIASFENLDNICPGSATTIQAKIKNYGYLSVTSVKVGWSVNGVVQTPMNVSAIIYPLNEATVSIGSFNFSGGTNYEIKAWIDSLNGGLDGNPYNDTLISGNFHTAFPSGTYSIGNSSAADFSTLDEAISVLNQNGICGAVVFELESGTYTGQYVLTSINGLSSTNTITFQSQSGDSSDVSLQFNPSGSSYGYIFKLDNASNIKFKNLTFSNQSPYYTGNLSLSYSHNVEIDGCNFKAVANTYTNSYNYHIYIGYSNRVKISNNSFRNNPGAVYSNGSSYPSNNTDIDIINNSIYNFTQYGVNGYYTGDSSEVIGNTFRDASNGSGVMGINFTYGDGNLKIANNDIRLTANNVSYGIRLYYQNYYNYSSSTANSIINNFVFINTSTSTTTYGVYLYNAYYADLYYNTIKLDDCGSSSYALYDYYSYYADMKNNNIDGGDKVAMYFNSISGLTTSDYNNIYSTATYPIYYSGSRTFASYQTYSGKDSHSKSVAPNYVTQGDYHLHDVQLNNAGNPVAGITTDIEGNSRSVSTPDIGADEFTMLANDASLYAINAPKNIVAAGNVPIRLALQNMGTGTLYLTTLKYQIDAGSVVTYNWSGYLTPLAIDSLILVGSDNLASGTHTIKAWTMSPNNTNDLNKSNDTLTKTFQVQVMPRITVEPSILTGTIAACDDSITVNLKIKNEGGATLTGNIVGGQASSGATLEVVMLTYGATSSYYTNLVNALDETFTDYNLVYSSASSVAQLQSDLVGKDVIIMPYMNSTSYISTYQNFTSTFQSFVSNGGSFIFAGEYNTQYTFVTNTGLWNNTTYSGYTSNLSLTVNSHPITNGMVGSDFTSVSDYFFYHTGTPPNYTSLLKYGSYEVAGISNYGNGMVFYLGYRYYETNQTVIEELASNTLAYIANKNASWMYSNDSIFSLIPGDSINIPFVMNSTGLTNGLYTSSISLTSNDLGNPTVNVPCTLNVVGAPDISTSTNSLTFGGTFVNVGVTDSLFVKNTGCANLIISNITTANSAFTVTSNTYDTIVPGDSAFVFYQFSPSSAGSYATTSTIYSNDGNVIINLAGSGISAPVLTATPSPMNVTITNCNDSVVSNLQIQNTGGGTLTASFNAAGGGVDSVEVLILTYATTSSYLNNLKASLGYTFSKYNSTDLNTTSASTLQNQITSQEPDVIIIPFISSGSYSAYTSLATTLQNYTNAGGTVIFAGHYYSEIFGATGLISGTRISNASNATLTTIDPTDPITLGFPTTYSSGSDYVNYYTFSGTGITTLVKYGTYDMAVRKPYGNGYVIVIGHYFYNNSGNYTKAIISNALQFVSDQKVSWLTYSQSTANLSSGSSALKAITFKSAGLATGTYTAKIKITSNSPSNPVVFVPCTLTVLNEMPNGGVNLGADATNCGALTLNAGTYNTYNWNTGNTTQTISAVSTGTYSVTVTNGGFCQSRDTISVTINPIPSVNLSGLPTSSCTNNSPVTLNANPTGGAFTGVGVTNGVFNPAVAGVGSHTISYSYTNIYNCTNSANRQIMVYAPPTVSFSGLNSSYCPQATASTLLGQPSGGSFSGPGMVSNQFVPSIAGVGSHNIVYQYTDNHNCTNSDTNSTIVNAPAFTIAISGYQASYCANGAIDTISATPAGGTFSGHGVVGNTFNPYVAGVGTHYIKYQKQDVNSCLIADSVAVIVRALPAGLSISGGNQSLCANGNSINLTGYPAGGSFSGPGMSGNSFNPQLSGQGNHIILYTYTNTYGCYSSVTKTIVVNAIPSITFTNLQSQYCVNDNAITLSATPIGGSFSGNNVTNGTFDPALAGVGSSRIYYQATSTNGCSNTDSFNIIVNPLPVINWTSLPTPYCSNGIPVALSASPTGGTFTGLGVTGNSFAPSIAGVGTHQLYYTFTNQNGCSNIDSTPAQVKQVHGVSAGNNATISYNTTTQLSGLVTGGTGPFSFRWTPANKLVNANILSPNTTALTNSTQFTLTVTDNNTTCVNADNVLITVTGGPLSASIMSSDSTICDGEMVQFTVLSSGGSSNYTYSWRSNPAGFTNNTNNPMVYPSITTTYTCVVNDGTDSIVLNHLITVNATPQPLISNLNNAYCNNEAMVMLSTSPAGGSLIGSGIVGNTFNPATASLGQNMVIYSITSANNCYGADTIVVLVQNAPSAYAGKDTTLPCLNGGIVLGQQPINGVNYQWTPAIGLSNDQIANPTASPNLSINYALTATSAANGCTASDTISIKVTGAPVAKASNDTVVCAYANLTLTASGGDTYFWSNGGTGNSINVNPSTSTMYYVIVTQGGCADLDTVYVTISTPKPDLGPDTLTCAGNSITLSTTGNFTSYLWSNFSSQPTLVVDSTGTGIGSKQIVLQVTNNLNCTGSDTIMVSFYDCTSLNNVDNNLFTMRVYPNPSKGEFVIESNATEVKTMQMSIMDAQGRLVITKKISNQGGTFYEHIDLSTQPKGAYFIKLSNNDAEKIFQVLIQ